MREVSNNVELLTPQECAALLHVSPGTLSNWRVQGRGPRYALIERRVMYPKTELAAYLAASTRQSTSERAPKRALRKAG